MAKICELHIPHKFRFAGGMLASAVHDNECTCGGTEKCHGESEFEWRMEWTPMPHAKDGTGVWHVRAGVGRTGHPLQHDQVLRRNPPKSDHRNKYETRFRVLADDHKLEI